MRVFRVGSTLIAAVLCAALSNVGFAEDPFGEKSVTKPLRAKDKRLAAARNRAIRKVETQLKRLKGPKGRKKREDFFLVGKVEMTLRSRDAKVAFEVMKGQRDASENIVDYVVKTPSRTARKWKAFARFPDEASAQQGLLAIRKRYDDLQAYRAQLMRQYRAATMCRS